MTSVPPPSQSKHCLGLLVLVTTVIELPIEFEPTDLVLLDLRKILNVLLTNTTFTEHFCWSYRLLYCTWVEGPVTIWISCVFVCVCVHTACVKASMCVCVCTVCVTTYTCTTLKT